MRSARILNIAKLKRGRCYFCAEILPWRSSYSYSMVIFLHGMHVIDIDNISMIQAGRTAPYSMQEPTLIFRTR